MFNVDINLVNIDISSFNAENDQDMESMFYKCESITSLDLSHFDNKNTKSMGRMLSYYNSLTNLNIADFNIEICGETYLTKFDDDNK